VWLTWDLRLFGQVLLGLFNTACGELTEPNRT
jgi:hypothetical protein